MTEATLNFPPRAIAWRSAIIIFVITAIAMADRIAIAMLIGPIKQEFGIGDFQASLLVGLAFTSFYVLFLMPIGWAADRYSRRKVLAICLFIWSLATIACGWATGFVMLFLLRMLVGTGEAGMAPTVHGIIGDSFPKNALAKPLAMQGIGFQVGSAVGVAAAGAVLAGGAAGAFQGLPIIGEMSSWRIALVLIGIPGLAALALIPLLHDPKDHREKTANNVQTPLLPFFREHKSLVSLTLFYSGLSAVGLGCVTTWVPEYLQRIHEVPPMQTGAMLGSLLLMAAIFGQGLYAIIADWFAARGMKDAAIRIGILPIALTVPFAWMAFIAETSGSFISWLTALLLCLAPCNAISNTTVQLIAPTALRSRMAAVSILSVSVIGFTLGPALVGAISQYVVGEANLGMALKWVMVGSMAVSLGLMILLRPKLATYLQ